MTLVSGCASDKESGHGLMPMPEVSSLKDPGNEQFMAAIAEYVASRNAPQNTRYDFTRIDLDNDGRREGIVLMKAPHQYWCALSGCRMMVFKAYNDGFGLVSEIDPVRGPFTVSDNTTNGWKDIIVRISGRMYAATKDVALQFNGSSYPSQPAVQPPIRYACNSVGGVRIFP